jgi:hypothetical protein
MKGFTRPPMQELPQDALVPDVNRDEPPASFTHEVVRRQPFYFDESTTVPAGHFAPGTLVALVKDDGEFSTVIERHGVRVRTPFAGLRKL